MASTRELIILLALVKTKKEVVNNKVGTDIKKIPYQKYSKHCKI